MPEVKYEEFRVLIGRDADGEQQIDTADDDWESHDGICWGWVSRLIIRIPEDRAVTIITLPADQDGPVKVEMAAAT